MRKSLNGKVTNSMLWYLKNNNNDNDNDDDDDDNDDNNNNK